MSPVCLAGLALLLLSLWLQVPMWLVTTGQRGVARWWRIHGGAVCRTARPARRDGAAGRGGSPPAVAVVVVVGLAVSLIVLAGWVALVGLDLRG